MMALTGRGAKAIFILVLASLSIPLFAHPHVYIDDVVTATFSASRLERLDFRWTFDDLYSSTLISDYSRAKQGRFTAAEAGELRAGGFDNLENYHWFIIVRIGSREVPLRGVDRFVPTIEGNRVVYSFGFPLGLALPSGAFSLTIRVYDDTYYTAFAKMEAREIVLAGSPPAGLAVSIEKDSVKATWPGQWMPDVIVMRAKAR